MYIWVILATFIVAIASFNLSVRSDIRQIYVAPQAEATISKLALQHEAAEDYVRYQAKSNGAYTAGEVDPASLSSYLPEGFTIDEGAAIDEAHNYSFVYCLDTGTPNLSTKSSTCSGDSYRPYVITYGCIPQRWKSLSDGRPRTELISAMYNVFGFGGHIGYTIRPSERRKGYGIIQLEKALEKCNDLNIDKVLITCNEENIASAKTIEKCYGEYENTVHMRDETLRRYWITLSKINNIHR